MTNTFNLSQDKVAAIEALTPEQLKTVRLNIQAKEYSNDETREAVAQYLADAGNVADLLAVSEDQKNAPFD